MNNCILANLQIRGADAPRLFLLAPQCLLSRLAVPKIDIPANLEIYRLISAMLNLVNYWFILRQYKPDKEHNNADAADDRTSRSWP